MSSAALSSPLLPTSPSADLRHRASPSEPFQACPALSLNSTADSACRTRSDSIHNTDLTPLRAHYLKKSLVQLQLKSEIDALTTPHPSNASTLSFLGHPFSPPPADANPHLDLPFLRYTFRQFVLTFPFLVAAPRDFYSDKLQPFVSSFLSRDLSPSSLFDDDEDNEDGAVSEFATHRKLLAKVERSLSMFLSSATRLVEPEQVVRLSQADLDRLEAIANKSMANRAKDKDSFDVNVVGVRTVVDKGRMRSRAHDEFILRTRRSGYPDVFVPRRYGDFKTLASELQKAHPDESIRLPPAKDRRAVVGSPTSSSFDTEPTSPDTVYSPSGPSPTYPHSPLAREKNRLTLRSYLYTLLTSSTIASSPVMKSFLLSGPIHLSQTEFEDVRRREEADKIREDGRKKFAKEIALRVDGLREAVRNVKGDIMGKNGLTNIFGIIKVTPDIRDLPPDYQAVLEWARISLASTIFHQFVASDDASETFVNLKRIHGLMPYFMLKTVLKISNPMAMIRGVLDLFLAQPFGGRSLLQRMFSSSLLEEVKILECQIEAVKDKVNDPVLCTKIRQFAYAPKDIQEMYKFDAAADRMNLLVVVLRAPEEPVLSRLQVHRLAKAYRAHEEYLKYRAQLADSDDDDGPRNEDAWLLEDLKVLTHLYSRLKDREQLIGLIFEGSTAELLRDIITIFYSPLAQVYRAASIADSLGDLQHFINDLVKTVEQVEEPSQGDPHCTVQAFINLVQRHEQSFYHFVHKVHSKGERLFDGLMRWIELFLTVVRDGLGSQLSLEYLLPHTGVERDNILAEVDNVARHHYKLKVAYETKLRRRFRRTQANGGGDAEDEATQALVNGVVSEIDFGDHVQGDVDDLAAEETDEHSDDDDLEEEDENEGENYESDSTSSVAEDSEDHGGKNIVGEDNHVPRPVSTGPSLGSKVADQGVAVSHHHRSHHPPSKSFRSPSYSSSFKPDHRPSPSDPGVSTVSMMSSALPGRTSNSSFQPSGVNRELPSSTSAPTSVRRIPVSKVHKSQLALGTEARQEVVPTPHGIFRRSPSVPSQLGLSSSSKQERLVKHLRNQGRKAASEASRSPELEHIPKLLPVFVEMMRPLLRPRKIGAYHKSLILR